MQTSEGPPVPPPKKDQLPSKTPPTITSGRATPDVRPVTTTAGTTAAATRKDISHKQTGAEAKPTLPADLKLTRMQRVLAESLIGEGPDQFRSWQEVPQQIRDGIKYVNVDFIEDYYRTHKGSELAEQRTYRTLTQTETLQTMSSVFQDLANFIYRGDKDVAAYIREKYGNITKSCDAQLFVVLGVITGVASGAVKKGVRPDEPFLSSQQIQWATGEIMSRTTPYLEVAEGLSAGSLYDNVKSYVIDKSPLGKFLRA